MIAGSGIFCIIAEQAYSRNSNRVVRLLAAAGVSPFTAFGDRLTSAVRFLDNVRVAEMIQSRKLFHNDWVSIFDVCCRAGKGGCGGEEATTAHSVAIPRRGVFVRHAHHGESVGDANGALFFNAGDAYRVSHPLPGGDNCLSLHFRGDVLASAVARFAGPETVDRRRPFPHPHGPLGRSAYGRRRALEAALEKDAGDSLAVEERVMELLGAVLSDSFAVRGERPRRQRDDTDQVHRRWTEETRLLLNRRLGQRVLLSDIARDVHCSPFHLVRIFRRRMGVPIHRYLTRLRLRSAIERLRGGEDDLTRLALDLGFSSHAHFTDAFRREFGVAPSGMRGKSYSAL